ncbi:hypothetical protein [Rhizobium leguminosarum]|uniref:hypothetical protein n=1 Tax=Rhizobium leguminosarum TaxID=384 RepID=UPI001C951D7B|nr:hypothetical protein [Rhizobium leguminosarum]MBY5821450.1 hypothetical protein [Rhizobium leguminosarum]
MTSTHTPGPWKLEKEWSGGPLIAQVSKFVRAIYVVSLNSEADPASDAEANARLISAAPDLLAALLAEDEADAAFDAADEYAHRADAEGWLDDPTGSLHVNGAWDRANDLRAKAKELRQAAIAKATKE